MSYRLCQNLTASLDDVKEVLEERPVVGVHVRHVEARLLSHVREHSPELSHVVEKVVLQRAVNSRH